MTTKPCPTLLPDEMRWRPIEEAPRDGTVVLLRCSIEYLCGYAPKVRPLKEIAIGYYSRWWVVGVPGGHSEGGGDGQFTHFMPLPDAPEVG